MEIPDDVVAVCSVAGCENGYILHCCILLVVVEIEIIGVVEAEHCRIDESVKASPFLLCGAAGSSRSVHETAYAAHFQYFILFGVGDVFVNLGDELGSDALLDAFQNLEGVDYRRLLYAYRFADFYGM